MKDKVAGGELTLFPREGRLLDDSRVELLRTTLAIFDVELQIRGDGSIVIIHDVPLILERIGYLIYSFTNGGYKPLQVKRPSLKRRSNSKSLADKAMKFKQVRRMADLLKETTSNVLGLMTCIPKSIGELGLSRDQIIAFCGATPNGEELWLKYTERRDSSDTPEDYYFRLFMVEVLAGTDHPVLQ